MAFPTITAKTVIRRSALGVLVAGAACAALTLPSASADPADPAEPTATTEPTTPSVAAAPAASAADDCNAAGLATTISSVTASLSTYFAAHPDVNEALIDATRQPAFVAVGQFDGYFKDHPDQADDLRAIQAPLAAFKDRCGLQVSPTDALTVLADV
ncbi:MAG: heme-binding protein [Mycobacterium sp.]|jgi:hemophore-related protein|nr:heme-binding protein [Mycobacterium sp.]